MSEFNDRLVTTLLDTIDDLQDRVADLESELAQLSRPAAAPPAPLSADLLAAGDSNTSNAIIDFFNGDNTFLALAKKQTDEIIARDEEDDEKLAAGIEIAVKKGVLSGNVAVEPTTKIDVTGKSADQVADEIIVHLGDMSKGKTIIMQGLSGTGKGTTVSKLQEKLPNVVCWSNGNLFRSMTLFAVEYCKQKGIEFKSQNLSPGMLKECLSYLKFGKFNGKFDIKLEGLGFNYFVSEVQNTVLKTVGKNIPTVAELTQGEVVSFAGKAVAEMGAGGFNVSPTLSPTMHHPLFSNASTLSLSLSLPLSRSLSTQVIMEGRAQTLNHVRSPHRFELVLPDSSLIGKRRLAQRVGAEASETLKKAGGQPNQQAVEGAVAGALARFAAE
jgi:cytidylate kinase